MSVCPQGLRVCCPKKPDWGVGHVLSDDGGAKVTAFFLRGGKRTLGTTINIERGRHPNRTPRPTQDRFLFRTNPGRRHGDRGSVATDREKGS